MTAVTSALTSALLHFLWQGALVAAGLWLVLAALQHRSANARYLAAGVALVLLILSPVATVLFILLRPEAALTPGGMLANATQVMGALVVSGASSFAALQRWALPLWGCGAALCSLRFLRGYSTVETLRSSGEPADLSLSLTVRRLATRMGVIRSVQVLISSAIDGPSVIGWLRPVVLIPAATVLGLTAEQLELILAHELAHIRRHDYAVNMIQMAVETMLFYHPAVWWISARMRDERELCCDDVVIRTLGDRLTYARALTALERLRLGAPTLALASTDGSLSYRVQRLLEPSPSSSHPMKLPTLLTVCLALACAAPVIDSPKNKPAADRATAEQAAANTEQSADGRRDDSQRIAAGHSNPKETGDSAFVNYLTRDVTVGVAHTRDDIAGLRLAAIDLSGVSPALRDRIQLPVALGDTLASDSPSRVEDALRKVDSSLSMEIKPIGQGKAALLISGTSAGGLKARAAVMDGPPQPVKPVMDLQVEKQVKPKPINPDQPLMDFQVEKQVAIAPGNKPPSYPPALRMSNIEGQVTVKFVVDTTGVAEMNTFKEIQATDALFAAAVKEHLPAMRFIPAEVGHHKVRQIVQMPFVFTLAK